jgi:hypothetical protein
MLTQHVLPCHTPTPTHKYKGGTPLLSAQQALDVWFGIADYVYGRVHALTRDAFPQLNSRCTALDLSKVQAISVVVLRHVLKRKHQRYTDVVKLLNSFLCRESLTVKQRTLIESLDHDVYFKDVWVLLDEMNW